nr:MAG TPA: hypothetical protein [Caudoviricetes sp.]
MLIFLLSYVNFFLKASKVGKKGLGYEAGKNGKMLGRLKNDEEGGGA